MTPPVISSFHALRLSAAIWLFQIALWAAPPGAAKQELTRMVELGLLRIQAILAAHTGRIEER